MKYGSIVWERIIQTKLCAKYWWLALLHVHCCRTWYCWGQREGYFHISIHPNIKVNFEKKYVICLILAIVSNSWRAPHILHMDSNIEEFQVFQVQKKLQNSKVKLTKFCYDFAMALIQSADDRSALMCCEQVKQWGPVTIEQLVQLKSRLNLNVIQPH